MMHEVTSVCLYNGTESSSHSLRVLSGKSGSSNVIFRMELTQRSHLELNCQDTIETASVLCVLPSSSFNYQLLLFVAAEDELNLAPKPHESVSCLHVCVSRLCIRRTGAEGRM